MCGSRDVVPFAIGRWRCAQPRSGGASFLRLSAVRLPITTTYTPL